MLIKLRETINPNVFIPISDADKTMTVSETGVESKIKKLIIKGVPEDTFAFTLDYQPGGKGKNKCFKQLSCYINVACPSGVNKSCDLVAVTALGNGKYKVLVFDLKSDKPNIKETEKQLLNSELYVKYLMSMLESHCGVDVSNIDYRRAIVTTDTRCPRKNLTYRSNMRAASKTNYRIKKITVPRAKKEGSVHFNDL